MENYKHGFTPHGVYNLNIAHAILIEISNDGSCARYCDSRDQRLYLDNFMRV